MNVKSGGVFDSPGYESAMMEYYRRHLCRLDTWPECLLKTFEVMATPVYNFMWGPSEFTLTGTLKETDLTPNLAYIKVPVLYTCGEFDEATPSTVRHFRNQTKEATIKVFPGASHSHHLEAEEDYIATVRSFLKNHSSKSGLLLPGGLATT